MNLEQILTWIVVGGIAGLLAVKLIKGVRTGLVGAVLIGILGAFLGGWLFGQLRISIGTGLVSEIVTAFVGAVILLLLVRAIKRL